MEMSCGRAMAQLRELLWLPTSIQPRLEVPQLNTISAVLLPSATLYISAPWVMTASGHYINQLERLRGHRKFGILILSYTVWPWGISFYFLRTSPHQRAIQKRNSGPRMVQQQERNRCMTSVPFMLTSVTRW